MKRCLWLLCGLLLVSGSARAGGVMGDVQLGYRQDSFDWSIAGRGGTPNTLSELCWNDLRSAQLSALFISRLPYINVRATADYAWVLSGKTTDTDWFGDNKTNRVSYSVSNTTGSYLYDLSLGLDVLDLSFSSFFSFCLQAGYSLHQQHLTIRGGDLKFSELGIPLGHIYGLNSLYSARWKTLWTGVDGKISLACVTVLGSFAYHRGQYHGKGHWNLRVSHQRPFTHDANGVKGTEARMELHYSIFPCLFCGISGNYQRWRSGSGTEKNYSFYGGKEHAFKQPFNGAHWRSFSVSALCGFSF